MYNSVSLCAIILVLGGVSGYRNCNDCVPFMQCPEAYDISLHKRDKKSEELFSNAICGIEKNRERKIMPKVCCSDFASDEGKRIDNHPNQILLPKDCGAIKGDRIYGGRIADLYEFPWMALVSLDTRDGRQFQCGGTIIHKRYILTAAHCVHSKVVAGVRVGEYDVENPRDCNKAGHCESHIQDLPVEKLIVHKGYTRSSRVTNDIALIRLAEDIDFNHQNVDLICLPKTTALRQVSLDYQTVTVTGWGLTEEGRDFEILRKVNITTLNAEECNQYNQGYLTSPTNAESSVICAGEINKDSCNGDSGGPLMLEQKYNGISRFVQYGIVSNGPSKCGTDRPGIYTDVRKYMGWILDNMSP